MDVGFQADESDAFVDAIVGRSQVVVTERMVYTDTELFVRDVLGGDAPARLVVRQAGGELGDRTVYVAGDARLVEGERILAFVRTRGSRWYLTALGQSVWHVDARGALSRDIDPAHLMERDATGRVVSATRSPEHFETVEQLEAAVRVLPFGGVP